MFHTICYLPSASCDSDSAAEHRRFPWENRQSREGPIPRQASASIAF
ncbi:MAG: hypothetical protein IJD70_06880 [Clostridia bacterium]|nr:hypothetical protein [Clostridia bacterium]